jgi:hypothetical protein
MSRKRILKRRVFKQGPRSLDEALLVPNVGLSSYWHGLSAPNPKSTLAVLGSSAGRFSARDHVIIKNIMPVLNPIDVEKSFMLINSPEQILDSCCFPSVPL